MSFRLYLATGEDEAGSYEIRAVTKEGEGHIYPGGVLSKESFERYYEKAN